MHTTKALIAQHSYPIFIVRDFRHPAFGPHEKAVLFALASRMSALDSPVFPSVTRLAGDAGVSESTARSIVHWLEAIGVLVEVESPATSRAFAVNFDRLVSLPPDVPARTTGERKPTRGVPRIGGGVPREVTPVPHGGVGCAPRGLSQKEVKNQEKSQVTIPPTVTDSLVTYEHIRNAIASDVDLSRITPPEVLDEIATEYLKHPTIDVLAVIRKAGDHLRTEKGARIRNGKDHLLRRLEWAVKDSTKKTKPSKTVTAQAPPPAPELPRAPRFDPPPMSDAERRAVLAPILAALNRTRGQA